ncbi:hypothetical protein pb186bvf_001604 [Paramecium bursaria]
MIQDIDIEVLNFQVNKRREAKQKSSFNSFFSIRQAQSVELTENQNCQKVSDVSTDQSETPEKQSIGSYIQQGSDIFSSITHTTKFSCFLCHLDIDENTIITPCEHPFHQNCFRELLNKELKKKEFYIRCVCSFELNQMLKLKYFREDKTVYEDVIQFEINNIRKYLGDKVIFECEGGPYQEQKYNNQLNPVYEEKYCKKAFYIFDKEVENSQQFICGFCERKLFPKTNKTKIRLLNQKNQYIQIYQNKQFLQDKNMIDFFGSQ